MPFLAFGVGFQRTVRGGNGDYGSGGTTLNYDWNYEYIYDWILGNELNDPWPWNASAHPADPGTLHHRNEAAIRALTSIGSRLSYLCLLVCGV